MSHWEIIIIAVSVSIDALAVSISGALCDREHPHVHALLAALFFGSFQFIMPIIGFSLGLIVSTLVQQFDHWIAFLLLAMVGIKMIHEAIKASPEECKPSPFGLKKLTVLAIATSLDAMAVGASIAMVKAPILLPAVAMGVATAIISGGGVMLGSLLGMAFKGEKVFGVLSGLAIIGVGINILLTHICN